MRSKETDPNLLSKWLQVARLFQAAPVGKTWATKPEQSWERQGLIPLFYLQLTVLIKFSLTLI